MANKVVVDIITNTAGANSNILKYAAGVGAAVAAISGLVKVSKELLDAYSVQEQAETALAAAIKATGEQGNISLKAMQDYASSLQSVTLFGDEAILSGQAMLQSLADLDQAGLQKVTPGVLDFAQAMGINLSSAMNLVGKTIGSSTNALARYGIEIDATASKEEKLEQLTEQLESKFGGVAEAAADTASGGITQMSNALGDAQEEAGAFVAAMVTGDKSIVSAVTKVATAFANAGRELRNLQAQYDELRETGEVTGDLVTLNEQLENVTKKLAGANAFEAMQLMNLKDAIEDAIEAENRRLNNQRFMNEASRQGIQDAKDAAEEAERMRIVQEELARVVEERLPAEQKQINFLQEQIDKWAEFRDVPGVQALLTDLVHERNAIQEQYNATLSETVETEKELADTSLKVTEDQLSYYEEYYGAMDQIESDYYARLHEKKMADIEDEKERQIELEETAKKIEGALGGTINAFAESVAAGESFNEALAAAAKQGAATILNTLGQQALAQAALYTAASLVPGGQANIPAAIAYGTAATAAFTGAAAIQAFATGGDFMTEGPQLIMVGDNPGGRERVTVTPESSPNVNGPQGGNMTVRVLPREFSKFLQVMFDNKEVVPNRRA